MVIFETSPPWKVSWRLYVVPIWGLALLYFALLLLPFYGRSYVKAITFTTWKYVWSTKTSNLEFFIVNSFLLLDMCYFFSFWICSLESTSTFVHTNNVGSEKSQKEIYSFVCLRNFLCVLLICKWPKNISSWKLLCHDSTALSPQSIWLENFRKKWWHKIIPKHDIKN